MSVTIRNRASGADPVARSHRRASRMRSVLVVVSLLLLGGGGSWLMFASSAFAITDVIVEGATPTMNESIRVVVDDMLEQRHLGFVRIARNILLFDTNAATVSLRSSFGNFDTLAVTKEYPHAIRIRVAERVPIGAWCIGDSCQYFDVTGARWGSAVPSRGPLLLLVRDERSDSRWDTRLFAGFIAVTHALPDMGLRAITITFPDAAPGDMRVSVASGYDILFDVLGNYEDQLSTLSVLVADKVGDVTFRPQYIDVRTLGRAYYK